MRTSWPLETDGPAPGHQPVWASVAPEVCSARTELAHAARQRPGNWQILATDAFEAQLWEQLPPRIAALAACSRACAGWAVASPIAPTPDTAAAVSVLIPALPLGAWQRPALCPQPWVSLPAELAAALRTAVAPLPSETARAAVSAGIRLLHDDLDGAHQLAQGLEGYGSPRIADAWHAIMHRREGDTSNSQYWWRRVGAHPAGPQLCEWVAAATVAPWTNWRSRLLRLGIWNPLAHVELCHEPQTDTDRHALEQLQTIEALALLIPSLTWGATI